jgi:bacterioferritin
MKETKTNLAHGFDVAAIRRAAAKLDDGAVTEGYQADREAVVAMLNDALATELVCVLRYKRHYFTVSGPNSSQMRAEFLEHAQQEQEHADRIAERIVQLNGSPNFNPSTLVSRSHAEYDDSDDAQAMVRSDLIAERVAIESYRQMIAAIGEKDPTTSQMLTEIMAVEEEHADDMRDLMAQ